jgi:phospholipase C
MPGVINRVVILFFENHTVDNFASEVKNVNGDLNLPIIKLPPRPNDFILHDPPHGHTDWMNRAGHAQAERFTRAQIPNIYALMDQFTICDNYFSDYAGNSFPNHCFAIGADAEWAYKNPNKTYNVQIQQPGLPKRLTQANKSWANYGPGFAFARYIDPEMKTNVKKAPDFLADAKNGKLPNVSWVYGAPHQNFHAGDPKKAFSDGSSMSLSDNWLGSAINAIATGPHWKETMIFVTFDDWGGWTDHIVPPNIEKFPAGTPFAGEQYRYGGRVPCVVVGPYARRQHVSSVQSSHASLVAFVERLWNLAPSTSADARRRTAVGTDHAMADCYDLTQNPNPAPNLAASVPPSSAGAPASSRQPKSATSKPARSKVSRSASTRARSKLAKTTRANAKKPIRARPSPALSKRAKSTPARSTKSTRAKSTRPKSTRAKSTRGKSASARFGRSLSTRTKSIRPKRGR